MTEKKKLVVWVPLPPNSSWRGEGIAQTIENIVRNISPERKIEIVVSSKHAEMLVGLEKSNPNISVLTLGFRGKSTKKTIGYVSLNEVEKDSLWDLVIAKLPIIQRFSERLGCMYPNLNIYYLYISTLIYKEGGDSQAITVGFGYLLQSSRILIFWVVKSSFHSGTRLFSSITKNFL